MELSFEIFVNLIILNFKILCSKAFKILSFQIISNFIILLLRLLLKGHLLVQLVEFLVEIVGFILIGVYEFATVIAAICFKAFLFLRRRFSCLITRDYFNHTFLNILLGFHRFTLPAFHSLTVFMRAACPLFISVVTVMLLADVFGSRRCHISLLLLLLGLILVVLVVVIIRLVSVEHNR